MSEPCQTCQGSGLVLTPHYHEGLGYIKRHDQEVRCPDCASTALCGFCGRLGATIYRSTDGLWLCEHHIAYLTTDPETVTITRTALRMAQLALRVLRITSHTRPLHLRHRIHAAYDEVTTTLQQREEETHGTS